VRPSTGESDESLEVLVEFFVPSGEAAEVLEPGEAAFDAIALPIEFLIVGSLLRLAFEGTTATAPMASMWSRMVWLS
jgi:hypothetical protein